MNYDKCHLTLTMHYVFSGLFNHNKNTGNWLRQKVLITNQQWSRNDHTFQDEWCYQCQNGKREWERGAEV